MILLALDTCCGSFSFTVFKQGEVVVDNKHESPNKQAELMIASLAQELQNEGISFADIKQIVVTIGPGSFTGIRIGLSAAHGLVLTNQAELYGLTTLDVLLQQMPTATHAVLNAGKGQYYIKEAGTLASNFDAIKLIDAGEVEEMVNNPAIILAGNHPQALQTMPNSHALGELFLSLRSQEDIFQFKDPEPLYIREPDAVISNHIFK
jgi:tRNA threonylcarbamoyladenosine biosynthesis protein TsaB